MHRDHFADLTAKASDVARQVAFAGLALVWIMRSVSIGEVGRGAYEIAPKFLPGLLRPAAIALVLALGLDLSQYAISAFICGVRSRWGSADLGNDSAFSQPEIVLFVLKFIAYLFGYFFLLRFAFKPSGAYFP